MVVLKKGVKKRKNVFSVFCNGTIYVQFALLRKESDNILKETFGMT